LGDASLVKLGDALHFRRCGFSQTDGQQAGGGFHLGGIESVLKTFPQQRRRQSGEYPSLKEYANYQPGAKISHVGTLSLQLLK
jgi:hypothetical protein